MIDFMANIKNKKSMKKYNVKTLAEIAVLCIFCNNIQVWSMNGQEVMNPKLQEVMNPNPKDNSPISINEKKMNENSSDNMDSGMQDSKKIVVNSMRSENRIYMLNSKHFGRENMSLNDGKRSKMKNYISSLLKGKNYDRKNLGGGNSSHNKLSFRSLRKISSKKINKNKENKLELLFFNKEGNLSLCCCFNLFNGNMKNPGFRKKRKREIIRKRFLSECSENSQNAKSSQKDNSNDENNYEPRPAINNNIITLNGNTNFQVENNNGKNFTNGNPDSGNPQKIINDDGPNPYLNDNNI